jgi:hypothetical protein
MDALQGVLARNELRAIEAELVPLEALQLKHAEAEAELARSRAFEARAKEAGLSPAELSQQIRTERREERSAARQEAWRVDVEEHDPDKPKLAEKGLQVVDGATGIVSKLGDFVTDLLAGSTAPAQDKPADMAAFVTDPAARKEQQFARIAAQERAEADEKAIERIEEDMKAGKALASADIQHLSRAHQEQIRTFGDDAVRQMVDEMHKRNERYWKGDGRERD